MGMVDLEIERKFFVFADNNDLKRVLTGLKPNREERYYLYRRDGVELRFTKVEKSDKIIYQFDRMEVLLQEGSKSHNVRRKQRLEISKFEFDELLDLVKTKDGGIKPIKRLRYKIKENPKIEIKVYKGRFEGLIRIEVEFASVEEAKGYEKLAWFGREITDMSIGRDTNLPDLSDEEFKLILTNLSNNV